MSSPEPFGLTFSSRLGPRGPCRLSVPQCPSVCHCTPSVGYNERRDSVLHTLPRAFLVYSGLFSRFRRKCAVRSESCQSPSGGPLCPRDASRLRARAVIYIPTPIAWQHRRRRLASLDISPRSTWATHRWPCRTVMFRLRFRARAWRRAATTTRACSFPRYLRFEATSTLPTQPNS